MNFTSMSMRALASLAMINMINMIGVISAIGCSGAAQSEEGNDDIGTGTDADTDPDADTDDMDESADTDGETDTGVEPGPITEPGDPGDADISFEVRADTDQRSINPLIYGINGGGDLDGSQRGVTLLRSGGNRMTAYNWETNASNAGSDYFHQNDNYLVGDLPADQQDEPGAAVRGMVEEALSHDAAALLTIPICGYVAADKDGGGDVANTPDYLNVRFHPSIAFKGSELSATPDPDDDAVYQDEFVHWVVTTFPDAFAGGDARIVFSMDNEPDLWASTHARIHPNPVGYQELVDENIEFASAVKSVAPDAWVTGFVSYGYYGYMTLQDAPDQMGEAIDFFLAGMAEAEQQEGSRLVDVLDLHWYPEATGGGERITGENVSPESVEARVQAPRSLWDPDYVETSWIADAVGGPIQLLPWLQEKIDTIYPGTKLGFTEYNYGAAAHISGAIAEADVLGIFGREGVALATFWALTADNSMVYAAIRAYRSYDGADGRFGDTSVQAVTSDVERTSVYASIDADDPSRMVIVAINKTDAPLSAAVTMAAYGEYSGVDVYQLTDAGADIAAIGEQALGATNALIYEMPPLSVSVLVPKL